MSQRRPAEVSGDFSHQCSMPVCCRQQAGTTASDVNQGDARGCNVPPAAAASAVTSPTSMYLYQGGPCTPDTHPMTGAGNQLLHHTIGVQTSDKAPLLPHLSKPLATQSMSAVSLAPSSGAALAQLPTSSTTDTEQHLAVSLQLLAPSQPDTGVEVAPGPHAPPAPPAAGAGLVRGVCCNVRMAVSSYTWACVQAVCSSKVPPRACSLLGQGEGGQQAGGGGTAHSTQAWQEVRVSSCTASTGGYGVMA
jgi:hypothetical protein